MVKGKCFDRRAFLHVSASECRFSLFHLSGCCKTEALAKRREVSVTNHLNCTTDVFLYVFISSFKKFLIPRIFPVVHYDRCCSSLCGNQYKKVACRSSLLKKKKKNHTPTRHFYPLQCLKEAVR